MPAQNICVSLEPFQFDNLRTEDSLAFLIE